MGFDVGREGFSCRQGMVFNFSCWLGRVLMSVGKGNISVGMGCHIVRDWFSYRQGLVFMSGRMAFLVGKDGFSCRQRRVFMSI